MIITGLNSFTLLILERQEASGRWYFILVIYLFILDHVNPTFLNYYNVDNII
jgi:hypothetical protein